MSRRRFGLQCHAKL